MRVTTGMMHRRLMTNMHTNLNKMASTQEQLNTGKSINKPSDNPVGLTFAMRYRSEIAANDEYQKSVDSAKAWVEQTDTALGQTSDIMQRVKELAVMGANGTNGVEGKEAIAAEIDQLAGQLKDIANTQFDGKYIFNGQRTDQPPYPAGIEPEQAQFDKGSIRFAVSKGIELQVNKHAGQIFGESADADNIFTTLKEMSAALRSGDEEAVGALISKVDSRFQKISESYSDLGAKANRIDLVESRLGDSTYNLTGLLSKTEDIDFAEVITKFKMEESIYEATLSMGAKIIQPSLVDFLR